jgi:hypothetical protein
VLTSELEQKILDTTLKTRPPDATHWSVRELARHLRVSRMMVHRVWQRYDVQPHRVERFKISNDPKLEEKVRDIVGLYLNPPDRALVLCVDEKSQIQALDRTAPTCLSTGLAGTSDARLQAAWDDHAVCGFQHSEWQGHGALPARHRGREFIAFLHELEKEVPQDLDYGTHKGAAVQRWLRPRKRRRFHIHLTPTRSSWLNQVEPVGPILDE